MMATMALLAMAAGLNVAYANNTPPPANPSATANASSVAVAAALASSVSVSDADASAKASAVQHQGQEQTATGGLATASADNEGNKQEISVNETHPRNAPSLGQGSTYIGSCGAGGNAGGSGPNGAGFLGFSWTPADCKLLLAAEAYRAVGMVDAACNMVNRISTVQKAWKDIGMPPPDCVTKPVELPPAPVVDLSGYATKGELEQAFKRSIQK
jgi:hypothetical protein